jgi:hypothetical protein
MSGARRDACREISTAARSTQKRHRIYTMKNRTLGGDALEMIMRDVLEGLQDFTRQASLAKRKDDIENGRQKKKASARIIHFPRRSTTE